MATTTILQRVCFLPLLMALLNMSGCCAEEGQFYPGPVAGSVVTDRPQYRSYDRKWEQESISYKILNYPANLAYNSVRQEIKKAFDLWANVTNLRFPEMVHGTEDWKDKADIEISFGGNLHPDNSAESICDGNVGVIRFNPLYKFSTDFTGINLLQLAAHEIGHCLGLDHSPNKDSLMHMFSKSVESKELLTEDDIKEIQALYTAKKKTEKETQGQGNENGKNHTIAIDLE